MPSAFPRALCPPIRTACPISCSGGSPGVPDAALAPLLAGLRVEQAHRPLQIIRSGLQPLSSSLVHILTGHRDTIRTVAVTGDSSQAVTDGDDRAVIVWDLAAGTALRTLTGHRRPVAAVAVSRDGSTAVTGGEDGAVIVWDLAAGGGHRRRQPGGHRRRGRDRMDLAAGTALHTLTGHRSPVRAVAGDR